MNKITKNVLSLALLITVFGLPLMVGAQFAVDPGTTNLSDDNMETVLENILNTFLALIAILTVLGLVISGVMFITAGGSNERLDSAKAWLTYSIVGLVVALIGYIVVKFVASLLGAT
jgi:cytochrome bd-type quinol oxidase subunit 2